MLVQRVLFGLGAAAVAVAFIASLVGAAQV
jgi:hypothetical protein